MRRGVIATVVVLCVSSAASAEAGDRFRLTREGAEFTAGFFALTKGAGVNVVYGPNFHANCRKRVSLNVRRCHVNWIHHEIAGRARLSIAAFRRDEYALTYRVAYRLKKTDLECAQTLPASECTKKARGHETYTGG
jgi:hypothetical protein